MFDLNGRVALVTGAARGIGREIAMALAQSGAKVVATDIDVAALNEIAVASQSWKVQVDVHALDVTSPESWASVIDDVDHKFQKLDVLVNNAGIMESRSFFDTTLEDFRRTQRVNMESVFLGAKAAYPLLAKAAQLNPAGASIINMSSIFGQIGGDMNTSYCASKGAVRLFTKALAVDLGRAGTRIRVNSVHPGGVDTALGRGGLQAFIDAGAIPNMEAAEQMIQITTPLGRLGRTDDVAGAVVFLASDAAKFMTGSEITIDGGLSIV